MATQQLATLADLGDLGLKPEATSALSDATKTQHLVAASGKVASYLAKQYTFPLVSWGDDVRDAVVAIAVYTLMSRRGFNPANPGDQAIVKRHDDAIAWLRDVAKGIVEPSDIVDASPNEEAGGPLCESDEPLGWDIQPTEEAAE